MGKKSRLALGMFKHAPVQYIMPGCALRSNNITINRYCINIYTALTYNGKYLLFYRLLTFLMALSTLVLKPPFFQNLPLIYPLLRLISWNLTTRCLAVTGGGSVGECDRINQPSWFFWAHCNIVTATYVLTICIPSTVPATRQ